MNQTPHDAPQNPAPRAFPTWRSPRAWTVVIAVTALSAALDLWSKAVAFERVAGRAVAVSREEVLATGPRGLSGLIPPHAPVRVVPGWLDLTLVLNPGAVFGIGAGQRWFFITFTVAACVAGLLMFARWTLPRQWSAHAGIGLILGGGLGNLYDRLQFACVRDFLHPLPGARLPWGWVWPWGGREVWPYVSNVADALLIVGVAMLAWRALRQDHRHTSPRSV